jgi:hypothetical protein
MCERCDEQLDLRPNDEPVPPGDNPPDEYCNTCGSSMIRWHRSDADAFVISTELYMCINPHSPHWSGTGHLRGVTPFTRCHLWHRKREDGCCGRQDDSTP